MPPRYKGRVKKPIVPCGGEDRGVANTSQYGQGPETGVRKCQVAMMTLAIVINGDFLVVANPRGKERE